MRDCTYLSGARFNVSNLFRNLCFDIDRRDMSWVDAEAVKPAFTRKRVSQGRNTDPQK